MATHFYKVSIFVEIMLIKFWIGHHILELFGGFIRIQIKCKDPVDLIEIPNLLGRTPTKTNPDFIHVTLCWINIGVLVHIY